VEEKGTSAFPKERRDVRVGWGKTWRRRSCEKKRGVDFAGEKIIYCHQYPSDRIGKATLRKGLESPKRGDNLATFKKGGGPLMTGLDLNRARKGKKRIL